MSYTIRTNREPLEPREGREPDDCLIRGWNDWSEWFPVMNLTKIDVNWLKRSGLGYKLKPSCVDKIFSSERGRTCGIYEILARKERKEFVVYVGCSCRELGKSLPERINEYCADGSHKEVLINDALMKRYTLCFRYRVARNEVNAENDENDLLANYSYGWNVRTVCGTLPY